MVDTNDDRINKSNDVVWKESCYKRGAWTRVRIRNLLTWRREGVAREITVQ
jgi:hypothetical protein